MNITLDHAQAIVAIASASAVGLGAAWGLLARAKKSFKTSVSEIVADAVTPRMASIESDIAEVHHEVTFNNGSSLKDMVREMLATQRQMDVRLTSIEENQSG